MGESLMQHFWTVTPSPRSPEQARPMPPLLRPASAARLLLTTLAVLAGGCGNERSGEGILFACESDGRCAKQGHVCDSDGLCRPDKGGGSRRFQSQKADDTPVVRVSSSAGGGGQGAAAAGMAPPDESGADRCARRCSERQSDCTARCGEGTTCRQQCGRSTDACYARCQDTEDAWEAARRRREGGHCLGDDGRPRRCSEAEALELRMGMSEASKMLCRDRNGRQALCPEQLEQLERSKRFVSKE